VKKTHNASRFAAKFVTVHLIPSNLAAQFFANKKIEIDFAGILNPISEG
jgi:hypothetical protein